MLTISFTDGQSKSIHFFFDKGNKESTFDRFIVSTDWLSPITRLSCDLPGESHRATRPPPHSYGWLMGRKIPKQKHNFFGWLMQQIIIIEQRFIFLSKPQNKTTSPRLPEREVRAPLLLSVLIVPWCRSTSPRPTRGWWRGWWGVSGKSSAGCWIGSSGWTHRYNLAFMLRCA